jgi:hypothetical protein
VTIDPSTGDLTTGQNISQITNVIAKDNHGAFSNSLAFKIVVGDSGDATVMTSDLASTNNIVAELGGTDTLNGSVGIDYLFGGSQDDILIGKGGGDWLSGGGGDDIFKYLVTTDSRGGTGNYDTISDYTARTSGSNPHGDQIDFSAIDSDANSGGIQHFVFDSSQNASAVAGHITWSQDAVNNETIVHAAVVGDGTLEIHLSGVLTLHSQDFIV